GCTVVALFALVRLRVGLNYSPRNLALMLAIYLLAAVPFFTGGLVITVAISRFQSQVNAVYAADLLGPSAPFLLLLPLPHRLARPVVVLASGMLAWLAAVLFAPPHRRMRIAGSVTVAAVLLVAGQWSGKASFDVTDTKGHESDRVLFSKWNSFSRVGVYERPH